MRPLSSLVLGFLALSQVCKGHKGFLLHRAGQPREKQKTAKPEDAPFSCCDEAVQEGRPSTSGPAKLLPEATEPIVFLERVGLEGSGVLGVAALAEAKPSRCLTATPKEDAVGGFGLHLQSCESSLRTFRGDRAVNNSSPTLKSAQQFRLMANGELHTAEGQCVRRMHCGSGKHFAYDVGSCKGPGYVAKFLVYKVTSNDLHRMQLLGFPADVLQETRCELCGPYQLLELCVYRGEWFPSDSGRCGEFYKAEPGFTKLPSTYIGDAAVQGRLPHISSIDTVAERLTPLESHHEAMDLAGLAPTDSDSRCGSYATDGLTMDSFFFLHRAL